jgi:hypothetical protein
MDHKLPTKNVYGFGATSNEPNIKVTNKKKVPIGFEEILLAIMGFLLIVMQVIIGLCQVLPK